MNVELYGVILHLAWKYTLRQTSEITRLLNICNVLKYVLYDIKLVNESRLTLRLFAVVFILLMVFCE